MMEKGTLVYRVGSRCSITREKAETMSKRLLEGGSDEAGGG